MLDSAPPPEPKFWKALLTVALLLLPFFGTGAYVLHWPLAVSLVLYAIATFGFAGIIHKRVQRDSAAQWEMNFSHADRATNVPPDARVGRK